MKLTTHLHLIPSLRIDGTTRPLLHTPSWNAKGQNYENLSAVDTSELPAALLLLELMLGYLNFFETDDAF